MLPLNTIIHADNLTTLRAFPSDSIDACVTDPPYGLGKEPDALAMLKDWLQTGHHDVHGKGFMSKEWDAFVPQPMFWSEVFRVLKPGAHVLCFAGTRTYDLMTLALRLAGFEIRDTIRYMGNLHYPAWVYGSGFPKSLDVSKAFDKRAKARRRIIGKNANDRTARRNRLSDYGLQGGTGKSMITEPSTALAQQWQGWGTALKPAWEPIIIARKPLIGTVADNLERYGTGAINIEGCKIGTEERSYKGSGASQQVHNSSRAGLRDGRGQALTFKANGRFPANLIHDGSDEIEEEFAQFGNNKGAFAPVQKRQSPKTQNVYGDYTTQGDNGASYRGDTGTASRFFYSAKASKQDREEGLEDFPDYSAAGLPLRAEGGERQGTGQDGTTTDRTTTHKNTHPTVKPTKLMQYLIRLVTPKGGIVLDPFAGSGSTCKAAVLEGFDFIGIEQEAEYVRIAEARVKAVQGKFTLSAALQKE